MAPAKCSLSVDALVLTLAGARSLVRSFRRAQASVYWANWLARGSECYGVFTTFAAEHIVSEPMVPRTAKSLRAVVAGVAALILSFSLLRPAADLFAILIRRHWTEAWFSGLIVWYLDFFAAGLAIAIAILIGRYSFRVERHTESKADRVDRLLYLCALAAVLIGVFQWAEGHYLRASVGGVTFLFVIPWLGKRWINRADRRAGI